MTDIDAYARRILSDWSWAGDEGTFGNRLESSASSPESFESSCSSPDARSGTMGSCQTYVMSGRKLKPKVKMSTKRRMKASEREKLRMRSLAEALHQLRDYLPPVYSRRGQPLTKIQTLKYTIQYIKELSNVLEQCHVTDSDSS